MPSFDVKYRRQKIAIWDAIGSSADGDTVVSAPRDIRVRWDTKQRTMLNATGQPTAVDVTAVVGEYLATGSLCWLAPDQSPRSDTAVEQWYGTGSAGDDAELMEITAYSETPDMRARQFRRTIGLVFYKGSMP